MTTGDLGGGLGGGGSEAPTAEDQPALAVDEAIALVDRILAERGRRSHLFGWLKRPGGGSEDWLAVDAYYPGNRLVVVYEDSAAAHGELFRDLVPAHGLRLLTVRTAELAAGREAARALLERRLAELGPSPRHVPVAAPGHGASTAAIQPDPAQPKAGTTGERQAAGVLAGLALAAALVIEVYFGVARLGLDSGNVLLAFGLALDACSRALGALAAWRAGETEWAWWCALGGSPLAAGFALMQRSGPVKKEPAPLAGLIGVLALLVLVAALLTGL